MIVNASSARQKFIPNLLSRCTSKDFDDSACDIEQDIDPNYHMAGPEENIPEAPWDKNADPFEHNTYFEQHYDDSVDC